MTLTCYHRCSEQPVRRGVTTALTLTLVRRSGRYSFTATAFGVTFMRGS